MQLRGLLTDQVQHVTAPMIELEDRRAPREIDDPHHVAESVPVVYDVAHLRDAGVEDPIEAVYGVGYRMKESRPEAAGGATI